MIFRSNSFFGKTSDYAALFHCPTLSEREVKEMADIYNCITDERVYQNESSLHYYLRYSREALADHLEHVRSAANDILWLRVVNEQRVTTTSDTEEVFPLNPDNAQKLKRLLFLAQEFLITQSALSLDALFAELSWGNRFPGWDFKIPNFSWKWVDSLLDYDILSAFQQVQFDDTKWNIANDYDRRRHNFIAFFKRYYLSPMFDFESILTKEQKLKLQVLKCKIGIIWCFTMRNTPPDFTVTTLEEHKAKLTELLGQKEAQRKARYQR